MTRLLLVTNERQLGTEYGFRAAYEDMEAQGELERFAACAPVIAKSAGGAVHTVLEAIRALRPTVILVQSPKAVDWGDAEVQEIVRAARGATVLYWEGDPWSRGKPPTRSMGAWCRVSDIVFSVAMGEQASLLRGVGARRVQFIPHTYCQVQFAAAIKRFVPFSSRSQPGECVMIGSRLSRAFGISRIPGARDRLLLVREMERRFCGRFSAYGSGWRGTSARGPIPFGDQMAVIQAAGLSVNWDHFPSHSSYASDRLPISMAAGRPHVTTRHPDFDWLPGSSSGLFLVDRWQDVVDVANELAGWAPDELQEHGRAAFNWVVPRLSDVEAARFMLTQAHIGNWTLPDDPWGRVAEMVED